MGKFNVLLFFLLFGSIFLNDVFADNAVVDSVAAEHKVDAHPPVHVERRGINDSKSVIKEIISNEPFINIKKEKKWHFIDSDENKEDDDTLDDLDIAWPGAMLGFITVIIEAALWLLPLVIVFYLFRYRKYWLNLIQGKRYKKDEVELPDTLFGLDVREESLPDDIEQAASELWKNKQFREAISLLYRASLTAIFKKYKFTLASGATEEDCIRQLNISSQQDLKKHPEAIDTAYITQRNKHFNSLTQVWISVAYAHHIPDDAVFYRLCKNWNHLFVTEQKVVANGA
jgi:hypothetical protein